MKRRDFRSLSRFISILSGLVTAFALLFQLLMAYEGQQHSIITGFYWTLSTMSTLGYGDVSFSSDPGRIFSIVVLLSGMIFMLVLLPFTFIELFYEPWIEARAADQIPRTVPETISDHVILTFYGPVATALIDKLTQFNYPYVVILSEAEQVESLRDKGIRTMLGELNDPQTWLNARVGHAALVATTRDDIVNTSVVFTVRGITDKTPVIATVRSEGSVEVLKLAGCNRVLDLTRLVAEALSRRAIGGKHFTHVIGKIDDLIIAEVDASATTLVGKGYTEAQWLTSVSIVGFWARGTFEIGQPESVIEDNTLLLIVGSRDQMKEFDANFQAKAAPAAQEPVIVIGGGRVGRATAKALKRRGMDCVIIEQLQERISDRHNYIHGSGADKNILQTAGIEAAKTVIITTGDDETNIYLTIFCRLLRPDIQIICRATFERNLAALHRAGCDLALSYASLGSNALFNLLHRSDLMMIAEGLDVFKVPVPKELAGKTLAEANFRQRTHCSVIGVDSNDKTVTNPDPNSVLPEDGEIVLIGTPQSESEFLKLYSIS
ncbi:MAG: voltage-gated potassium channel [Granulosicoccus sp.]|jgi:voltage-gated potassium channel